MSNYKYVKVKNLDNGFDITINTNDIIRMYVNKANKCLIKFNTGQVIRVPNETLDDLYENHMTERFIKIYDVENDTPVLINTNGIESVRTNYVCCKIVTKTFTMYTLHKYFEMIQKFIGAKPMTFIEKWWKGRITRVPCDLEADRKTLADYHERWITQGHDPSLYEMRLYYFDFKDEDIE